MKLSEHVDHLRELIEAAFDKQFARLGFGKTKQMDADKLPAEVQAKRERLVSMLDSHTGETGCYDTAREKLLDELTFTLFNRLAAIKVMEAASLFPPILTKQVEHGDRSFGHKAWLEINPHMRDEELEGIRDYLKNAFDELGHTLPLYSKAYPYAFLPDAVSLNDIIDAFNAVEKDQQIISAHEDGIWQSDDVLGWLYESYNNKKKQAHKVSKAKTEYNKVSLQSQVYTPRWVVQFLVDNSLGKMYLEMYPHSEIKNRFKIANAPTTQTRKPKPLHEVRTIDPACGSGNFLLYAFDLYYELYLDQIENHGADYEEKDIPKLIIENNLHGIDLDDRAVQLAQLGLYIKAKKKRRTIGELSFKVVSSDFYLPEYNEVRHIFEKGARLERNQKELIEKIWKDLQYAYKFGSLVHIDEQLNKELNSIEQRADDDLFAQASLAEHKNFSASFFSSLIKAVEQYARTDSNTFLASKTRDAIIYLELLTSKYDVATANPPYTDSSDFGTELKIFIEENYRSSYKFNTNLYASFIKRCCQLTNSDGKVAMVHPPTFMYIKTFEDVRKYIIKNVSIDLFVEWGYLGMFHDSARVDAAMYILDKAAKAVDPTFIKLNHIYEGRRYEAFVEAYDYLMKGSKHENVYTLPQSKIKLIKTWPFIYWISDEFRENFGREALGDNNKAVTGLMTGNNNKYLRFYWEVNQDSLSEHYPTDKKRWVGYQKGGPFVRWYGNNWVVVDFENDGANLATTDNKEFYFKEGISYSASGSKGVSFRSIGSKYSFDKGGPCIFNTQEKFRDEYLLGFMNSKLCSYIVDCLNPTVNRQVGDIRRIPIVIPKENKDIVISGLVKSNIKIKKKLCEFFIIEKSYVKSLFEIFGQRDFKGKIKAYLNFENYHLTQVYINEAIINKEIFDIYDLTPNDKSMVLAKEGNSIGELPVSLNARNAYLSEPYSTMEFPLDTVRDFINALPAREFSFEEQETIEKLFPTLYQSNNDLEDFCINYQVNPINVWYWFKQNKGIPQQRMQTLAMEFLADMIREILMDDDDGIIPLVSNTGEKVLLDRIEEKFLEKGFNSAQYSSFDSVLVRPLNDYINNFFFEALSDHLNLFMYMPKTPFIWHLTSGPQKGFDCYIIIYKWNRDNLLRLRSVYIENRERALQNRQSDLTGSESAEAQNEKERIFKQLKEIDSFKNKIDELLAEGYNPTLDDGVGKNIAPLQNKKMLAYDVLNAGQLKKYLNADW